MKMVFNRGNFNFSARLEQTVYAMPFWQKMLICLVAFMAPCVAFWFLLLGPKLQELNAISSKIPRLGQEVTILQKKAKLIPQLEAELEEMDRVLKKAMKLLPESKDISAILMEISSLGNEEHLDFLSFSPGSETRRDFYAEIPVSINLNGPFHNTMRFFDKVSRMNRIVHIKNVTMGGAKVQKDIWSKTPSAGTSARKGAPSNGMGAGGRTAGSEDVSGDRGPIWIINTRCTAVTYRFLTGAEQKALAKGKKSKKRRRR